MIIRRRLALWEWELTTLLSLCHVPSCCLNFLTIWGSRRAVAPVLTTKSSSEFVKIRQNKSKGFWHEKTPETLNFQGFSHLSWSRSALREFQLSLGRLPGTSENTWENWDGFAFSARFCLILAVCVSKNRDPRHSEINPMEWGFAAYVLHTHCIPGRWMTAQMQGSSLFPYAWFIIQFRFRLNTHLHLNLLFDLVSSQYRIIIPQRTLRP